MSFFLTICRLRQGFAGHHLSNLFCISQSTVSRIFITWVNFMYSKLRVGRRGDPVAERTRFAWAIMSPGTDLSNAYLTVNSTVDHNRLRPRCSRTRGQTIYLPERRPRKIPGATADTKQDYPGKGTVLSCPIIVRAACAE